MRKLLIILFFATLIRAADQPYSGKWVSYAGLYKWAFEGTKTEMREADKPIVTENPNATSYNLYEDRTNAGHWKYYIKEYDSDGDYLTTTTQMIAKEVDQNEFDQFMLDHDLQDNFDGSYSDSIFDTEDDSSLTSEVANLLGHDSTDLEAKSGDFSETEIHNDSPNTKNYEIVIKDIFGHTVMTLESGEILSNQSIPLKNYGDIPAINDIKIEYYDEEGGYLYGQYMESNQEPTGEWFNDAELTVGDGYIYANYDETEQTQNNVENTINNYDHDFAEWVEDANSAGNINFDQDLSRGVRAGIESGAPAITNPIIDAINNQNNDLQAAIDGLDQKEDPETEIEFGDNSTTNLEQNINESINDSEQLDGELQETHNEIEGGTTGFSNKVVSKIDSVLEITGDASESATLVINKISESFSYLDIEASTGFFQIIPANSWGTDHPPFGIDFSESPFPQMKTFAQILHSLLWTIALLNYCVKTFKWAVT